MDVTWARLNNNANDIELAPVQILPRGANLETCKPRKFVGNYAVTMSSSQNILLTLHLFPTKGSFYGTLGLLLCKGTINGNEVSIIGNSKPSQQPNRSLLTHILGTDVLVDI